MPGHDEPLAKHSKWLSQMAAKAITQRLGDKGAAWVENVDAHLDRVAKELGFVPHSTLTGGAMSVLAVGSLLARPELGDVVLKSGPDVDAVRAEVSALLRWGQISKELGREIVPNVIASNKDAFVMSLVKPGGSVEISREPTTVEIANVVRVLQVFATTPATGRDGRRAYTEVMRSSAEKIFQASEEQVTPATKRLVEKTMSRVGVLPLEDYCLVHGDLWSRNLLAGENGWRAIDPLPGAGGIASDAGFWAACAHWGSEVRVRVSLLAKALGLEEDLVKVWAQFGLVDRLGLAVRHNYTRVLNSDIPRGIGELL